eukprot:1179812-Prorocentrum_minimum.AAC.3
MDLKGYHVDPKGYSVDLKGCSGELTWSRRRRAGVRAERGDGGGAREVEGGQARPRVHRRVPGWHQAPRRVKHAHPVGPRQPRTHGQNDRARGK